MNRAVLNRLRSSLEAGLADVPPDADLLSIRIRLDDTDPVDWLCAQTLCPRIYWRGRDDAREYAGIGSVGPDGTTLDGGIHDWAVLSRLLAHAPEAIAFFGMRFDEGAKAAGEWLGFSARAFVIPEFMLTRGPGETALVANVCIDASQSRAACRDEVLARAETLILDVSATGPSSAGHGIHTPLPRRDDWLREVDMLSQTVREKGLSKVVLARRLDLAFDAPPNPFVLIKHFRAMKSPAYFFCWEPTPGCAFLGSSPEQFVTRCGTRVASEALAGTRRRGVSAEEDAALREALMCDAKDRHEHALVHAHVRSVFQDLCDRVESEEAPAVLQLILVQHLLQRTVGWLREGVTDESIINALHPTPAVGGVPTASALATIREREPFDRGWYAAPLGVVGRDGCDLTVAIRSGLLHGNRLSLYCGAGIVAESKPEAEWDETEVKFANFLSVIHAD